jgi:glutaconate CoA-transferase subunit A
VREKLSTLDRAVDLVEDGMTIAIAGEGDWAPMALVRELVRRRRRGLFLELVPGGGLPADLLIGAGCVARMEFSNVELPGFGFAPHFRRRVQAGLFRRGGPDFGVLAAAAGEAEEPPLAILESG